MGLDDKLRQAGVDVEAMRVDAQAAVKAATPRGWEAVMIRSPWGESRCPGCWNPITVETLGVGALTKRLERARVLLFMLAIVCDRCVGSGHVMDALAEQAFE